MKRIFLTTILLVISISCTAYGAGGCPDTAERLEDFQRCMVPMRGEVGTVYRGTLASLHGDGHAALMYAMHRAPVVPPQVTVGSMYNPMVAVAASFAYRNSPRSRVWMYYSLSGMPYPVYTSYPW